jgi:hypothetical protein
MPDDDRTTTEPTVTRWTHSDEAKMLTLLGEGKTRREIAAEFGVTRNTICGKIHRLTSKPRVDPMQDMSDMTPNDETLAAFAELESGGGEMFFGTIEELFEAILASSDEEATKSAPVVAAPQNTAERPPSSDAAGAGADTPTSGYYAMRYGNLWFATDWRWFTRPNGTLQGIAHDRSAAIKLYCTGHGRKGNPAERDFSDFDLSSEEIKEIYAKHRYQW